jgi:anthraniloyl-CoA monooxygenase
MDVDESTAACERLFAPWLDGHRLVAQVPDDRRGRPWECFTRVTNDRWQHGRIVLLGDAAHAAHLAGGLATRVAMEDALSLVLALAEGGIDDASLAAYEAERKAEALRLQNAVGGSMEWFEEVRRYIGLPTEQFAYTLITRAQGVSHESLRRRDAAFVARVERAVASSDDEAPAPPPMFTPFRLRELTLPNRVVVAPVDLYSADDGTPNDFHLAHFGARALGGAGLVVTEMTCPSADARLSPGSTGLYRPEHVDAWRRITAMVHRWSPARSACSSATPAPRARRAACGRAPSSRWRKVGGRSSAPRPRRTAPACRCRAR